MARAQTAFADAKGNLHPTPEKATLADLAEMLGRSGAENDMTDGFAKRIFEKRDEIQRIFAEHDALTEREPAAVVTLSDRRAGGGRG